MVDQMYFQRDIDEVLLDWMGEPNRKPLVLRGARQTGKSASVREFGKRFDLFLELNLERHVDLSLVRSCSSAAELLAALSSRHNLPRFPDSTLLFLDEIQQSPEAIQWLRFLHEDHPQLAVLAAGSLLEVRLEQGGFSFPAGRVAFRTLRPFSCFEFFRARGKDVLLEQLCEAVRDGCQPPAALHEQALNMLREYLLVGGMPEAVRAWAGSGGEVVVQRVHQDLLQALAEDIQKYRGPRDLEYLESAFENLKHHYGARFRYENFAPGYRSKLMKSALAKLEGALLMTRAWPTSSLDLPLSVRPRSAPKLLALDVGLALGDIGVTSESLRRSPLEGLAGGRAAEVFAAQQILASTTDEGERLHFWVRESSRANAEVDFLLAGSDGPLPVEVKAGTSGSLKSMHQFLWRSGRRLGVRLHAGQYADETHRVRMPDCQMEYRLLSVPLYLAGMLRSLV